MSLSDDQRKQADTLQKDIDGRLAKLLTEEQQKQLKDARGGFGGLTPPGQIMTPFQQARLKLTDEQKKDMEALQKDADAGLAKLLDEEQQKRLKEMKDNFARAPGGFGAGAAKGPGGGFPGFGPPGGSSLFRAYRYAADYPGLKGRELAAGKTIEEIEREEAKAKGSKEKERKQEPRPDEDKDKE